MGSLQKSLQAQSSESGDKIESLHAQLQEVKGEQQASEDRCSKLQAALEEKSEKLNVSQQKLQVSCTCTEMHSDMQRRIRIA